LLLRHLFQAFDPAVTGRFFFGDAGHGPRQRTGYLVTPQLSLSCHMHAGKENGVSSKNGSAGGEASGIRRDTSGDPSKKSL
jgi:hypothetical protein